MLNAASHWTYFVDPQLLSSFLVNISSDWRGDFLLWFLRGVEGFVYTQLNSLISPLWRDSAAKKGAFCGESVSLC